MKNIPSIIKDYAVAMAQAGLSKLADSGGSQGGGGGGVSSYSFGDPEPVLNDRIGDYLGVFANITGGYYLPPISLEGLAKVMNANAHHGPILRFKRNMVAKWYQQPSPLLPYAELRKAALDFHVFGMCYFQLIYNRLGGLLRLERRPAMYMRAGVEPGVFFEVRDYAMGLGQPLEYLPGEIVCIKEDDVRQTIYGVPEYFGGLQSILLSADATLFRRKYYLNGSHVGYVFVTQDAGLSDETATVIEERIKAGKGPGNFKSMYLNIPNSKSKEPVKVIPIGDIATKDDINAIKAITQREALAMHRMQPGIAGIIPENMTGFGDLEKVMRVYCELEVPPMQQVFLILNDILPSWGQVAFAPPVWSGATQP